MTRIPGLDSVAMTTNGITLTRQLVPLLRAGLKGLNISLDSLDKDTYTRMARRNGLAKALAGIDLALQLGVNPVKVNCVVVRNENSQEIMKFVDWVRDTPIEVRFIEFMPFTGNAWDHKNMMSCKEILQTIQQTYPDLVQLPGNKSDTAKLYAAPGFKGRVGIISSMSDHFCGGCNRLRLMADGSLKVCLFGNSEVSLRDALRANVSEDDLRATIQAAVRRKKKQHAGKVFLCCLLWMPTSLRAYCTFSHLDSKGNFTMVDVGDKQVTRREAQARAIVLVGPQLAVMLRDGVALRKGNEALTVARLAGTMAAKKTADLIPLCHQLQLRFVGVEVELKCEEGQVVFTSTVRVDGKTGCELEALTAVSVAALTLYDMCKAVDKGITITNIMLVRKSGGKSGDYSNS
ncbi:hypothetical protein B566_EDAN006811 [Ephemera danica]|nr:hypothetical protein B566_EDAN006811 [Ephemera danica]